MGGRKSKDKGGAGERELCKILESYLGGSWIKTPGSGAYIGGKNQKRIQRLDEIQSGFFKADVVLPSHMSGLVVESKFYEDLPMYNLFREKGVSTIDGWIDDLEYDAGQDNWAWLCIKLNRKGWWVGLRHSEIDYFDLGNYAVYTNPNGHKYIFTDLNQFLRLNKDKILQHCQTSNESEEQNTPSAP